MATLKGYYKRHYKSRTWRLLRYEKWIAQGKKCPMCDEYIVDAGHLDHIKPVPMEYEEGFDFFEWDNLQLLHADCHSRKTRGDQQRVFKPRLQKRPARIE